MRLSTERINTLKLLLKEHYGLEYSDEQAQEAGLAIMRFVVAKAQTQKKLIIFKENEHGTACSPTGR